MQKLYLQPTPLAQWYALVNDAQCGLEVRLEENIESYLVYMLMRFIDKPDISGSIVAMEFLESLQQPGRYRSSSLQEVGDKCLILSGFYPDQVKKRNLKESYYIDLGQNAYYALAGLSELTVAGLYNDLSESFVVLKDVMQAMCQDHAIKTKTSYGKFLRKLQ